MELAILDGPDAETTARALLHDAESRTLARGKSMLSLHLPLELGPVADLCRRLGYDLLPTGGVFMALVTDLRGFLLELQPELTCRLQDSPLRDFAGALTLRSGDQQATLNLQAGSVEVTDQPDAPLAFEVAPETLPLLLFGRLAVPQAHLQNQLRVRAEDPWAALRLLETLFPRRPIYLPRVQWW